MSDYRVVLVQPSTKFGVQSLFTHHKSGKEGIGHKPPLAILILGTYLRSKNFPNVFCIDAQLDDLTPEQTVDRIAELKPDLVGFTVWTDFWYPAWETVRLMRERLPKCKIILGGPHCSVYPKETLQNSSADFVVRGDAEDTLLTLVDKLAQGESVGDLPGLWRKEDGQIRAPIFDLALAEDLTKIPIPDRTLLPYKRYTSVLSSQAYETTMVTSRGCPHKCNFCKMDVQKVYCRTSEQVVDEFESIINLGITDVQVYDDTFTWSKKRVLEICQGIIDRKLKINWAIRDRVKRADSDLYKIMKEAGCYRIHFGVETGSKRILDATGKATTLEEAEYALKLAKQADFVTMAYYMFGFPDETDEDAWKTIDFSLKLDADYSVFNVVIPYPGTALYDIGLERKIIPFDFWLEYTKNPVPDFTIPHLIEGDLDRQALLQLKSTALGKHYLRPKRIFQELKSLRSFAEFKRKGNMAIDIISDVFRSNKQIPKVQGDSRNFNTVHNLQKF
ncbi:MAG: hypothetical protein COV66_05205 [Nitrospinae bacterium CG11_big_fil_rev_8_21_14_0_20_45_15]|nr:MAG: hypothetical protein COV66_05205 [Nitrospinae bacterium CG11_big_fil_rev_8_21_14_0_20_45_15]